MKPDANMRFSSTSNLIQFIFKITFEDGNYRIEDIHANSSTEAFIYCANQLEDITCINVKSIKLIYRSDRED